METMYLRTPIITYDKWEIIKNNPDNIIDYTQKILSSSDFREKEVEKNYQYITTCHSLENHYKIFSSAL